MRQLHRPTLPAAGLLLILAVGSARADETPETAKEIRAEALRKNLDPDGRPLPLAGHWHASGFHLGFQVDLIRRGHHILPFLEWPGPNVGETDGLAQVRKWNLPLTLIHGNQWVSRFYHRKKFTSRPPREHPGVLNTKAERVDKISPFGPVEPWEDLGKMLATSEGMRAIQEAYPDPPLVLVVTNNEPNDLEWHDVETSQRYLDLYGKGRSDAFKRRVLGDGYIKRYRRLIQGIREGFDERAWKANSLVMGYGSVGPPHFGRPDQPIGDGGWLRWADATKTRTSWNWYAWDGGLASYYDNAWEQQQTMFNLWSDQTSFMNHVFQKERALALKPDYWYELIYWDGGSDKAEQYQEKGYEPTTGPRYRGWVQYGMWMLRPRVAREWESSTTEHEQYWWKMKEIIRAVDLVHADPMLRRFWRKGELVPNTARKHPFQSNVPAKFQDEDRWFRLRTSLDPERPWKFTTKLPVWSLARVVGDPPKREWLVYAHAPLGDKEAVEVTIPDYGPITVDVSVGGTFFHVKESEESVTRVGAIEQVDEAPVNIE